MRRLLSALTVAAGVPVFLAVPVVSFPAANPHPVRPHVEAFAVPATAPATADGPAARHRPDRSAAAPGGHRHAAPAVLASASRPRTHRFDLVGATWRTGTLDPGAASVQVRVHRAGGWSGWTALAPQDGGADGGSADARRAAAVRGSTQAAEPVWVGGADGVQARVVGQPAAPAVAPSDLRVVLVDGGSSAADADPAPSPVPGAVAAAGEARPQIYTRADWGADESLRRSACPSGPDYSPTIKMGFIHHTDGGNGYTRRQVPSIIRSIYAYHVRSNGWCDVGYNYLVDRFGRIWEGRYGGITKAVIGAHTGGFNYDTFGVALIGTFSSARPTSAMTDAVQRLFAWRMSRYYLDPRGKTELVAGSFSGSRFPAGRDVTFKQVSGHRDADFTSCPGAAAYAELPDIRAGIVDDLGAGFADPSVSATSVAMAAAPVVVRSRVIAAQSWQLTVTDAAGTVVKTVSGSATRRNPVAASWDLTGVDGVPAMPGAYTLTLTGAAADGAAARDWSTSVRIRPPLTLKVPAQVTLGAPVVATGHGVPGHSVTVSVSAPAGEQPVATVTVPASGRWSAGVPVTADRDLDWVATDADSAGYARHRTTQVGPDITAPVPADTLIDAGSSLPVSGTALPAAGPTVRLMTAPAGSDPGADGTAGPTATVAADGTWSTSLVPTGPTTFWAVDARGLRSAARTVYPLGSPTGSAPATGYTGHPVVVTGDAGGPAEVTLSRKLPGQSWDTVRTVHAHADGDYRAKLPLPDEPGTVAWRAATGHGSAAKGTVTVQPAPPPTIDGPRRAPWSAVRALSGAALPGDLVSVSTAPAGSTAWALAGSVRAGRDGTWSLSVRFTRDLQWRAATDAGTSPAGTTVIKPTIHARHRIDRHTAVRVHGKAMPHHRVVVSRRTAAGDWAVVDAVRAQADGRWELTRHLRRTTALRARSHRQNSGTVTVTVG